MSIRRTLRRMRRKDKPEEKVFERFSERFGAPASQEREPRQEPREDPRRQSPGTTPPPTPVAPPSPAFEALGLGVGASKAEIAAAYRRLARAHHPDKVAGEPRDVREESERRMKEINAAYSELKRQG